MHDISTLIDDQIGIRNAELLPRPDSADIKLRLSQSIAQSQTIRAAVAYWTVGPDDVSPLLATRLSHPNSFLCVDVHFPTDLDQIDRLDDRGANVFLHLRHLGMATETINRGLPHHLMHTKLLLFDMDDDTAEIWSGSHNWTLRAIGGPNVEASLVLRVSRESTLYADTVATLDYIHDLCRRFQHDELARYKQLQWQQKDDGQDELVPIIELRSRRAAEVKGVVALFGKRTDGWRDDWRQLREIEQSVILEITDSQSGRVFLYEATILHSGLQLAANPNAGGIAFSKRRYAVIDGEGCPEFVGPARPQELTLNESAYFVTLQVVRPLAQIVAEEPLPADKRWVKVASDPLIKRMRPEHYDFIAAQRRRRVVMQVPAFLGGTARTEETAQTTFLSSPDLEAPARHPLIAWKMLKDSNVNQ